MVSEERILNKEISGYNNYIYFLSNEQQVPSFFAWKFKNNKMCFYFLKKQWTFGSGIPGKKLKI